MSKEQDDAFMKGFFHFWGFVGLIAFLVITWGGLIYAMRKLGEYLFYN